MLQCSELWQTMTTKKQQQSFMDGFLTWSKCNSMLTNAWCRSLVANRITNRKRIKCTRLRGLKIILACTDTQRLHKPFALFLLCLVSVFFIIIWLCPLKKAFDFVCLFVCFCVPCALSLSGLGEHRWHNAWPGSEPAVTALGCWTPQVPPTLKWL